MANVNDKAPDFTLHASKTDTVTLSALRGHKVVLSFFPATFTGVCKAQACAFEAVQNAFSALDAKVFGVSVDGVFAQAAFAAQNGITYPMLSDIEHKVIKAYDVVFENFAGISGYVAATRSVFVIDADGIIRYRWTAPNPGVEPDYDAVQKALSAI